MVALSRLVAAVQSRLPELLWRLVDMLSSWCPFVRVVLAPRLEANDHSVVLQRPHLEAYDQSVVLQRTGSHLRSPHNMPRSCLLTLDTDEIIIRFALESDTFDSPYDPLDCVAFRCLCLCSQRTRALTLMVAGAMVRNRAAGRVHLLPSDRLPRPHELKRACELLGAEWAPDTPATIATVHGSTAIRVLPTEHNSCAALNGFPTMQRGRHRITFTIEHTQGNSGAINLGLIDASVPFSASAGGTAWAINFYTGVLWEFRDPHSRSGTRLGRRSDFAGMTNGTLVDFWVDMDEKLFFVTLPRAPAPLRVRFVAGSSRAASAPGPDLSLAVLRPFVRIFCEGDRVSFSHSRVRSLFITRDVNRLSDFTVVRIRPPDL